MRKPKVNNKHKSIKERFVAVQGKYFEYIILYLQLYRMGYILMVLKVQSKRLEPLRNGLKH